MTSERRSKQILLQRTHTDGQEAHEKMFTTGNYQRNANQNYNEISPYTSQNDYHKKNPQTKNTGEGVEKRQPL